MKHSPPAVERSIQGASKGGRQKEFGDFFFSFSGLFRSLFGHFSDASVTFFVTFFVGLLLQQTRDCQVNM